MTLITISRRLRQTPFTSRVEAAGVKGYTVYNRMLLPTYFESLEADYWHLKSAVQIWDVSVERQVEIRGPDSAKLVQMLTPRDLGKMQADQCYYIPVVDGNGGMLNDPVAVNLGGDRWWISIADSDLLLWVKGVALAGAYDVKVFEPDVSPLAVQGPKSEELMARVFGETVRDIRFFRYKRLKFLDTEFVVARSGYSKQGGFEIYVEGGQYAVPLWDALMEAGTDLDVRAGCPNLIERVESGLLSYGNDMTSENNPVECGLEKFCNAPEGVDYFGRAALDDVRAKGATQSICAIEISGTPMAPLRSAKPVLKDGNPIGKVTSAVWSPGNKTNVSIAMVSTAFAVDGTEVVFEADDEPRDAKVLSGFWN